MPVYLDRGTVTPPVPPVADGVFACFSEHQENPSGVLCLGQAMYSAIEKTHQTIG